MGQTASSYLHKATWPVRAVWGSAQGGSNKTSPAEPFAVTPFVYKRRGSMYFDEDGHLAHEFYEEYRDKKARRSSMRRLYSNLTPQGDVEFPHPRLNVDFPIILSETFPR